MDIQNAEIGHDFEKPAAAAKLLQSCPTLCDPIDGSPPCRVHHEKRWTGRNTGGIKIAGRNIFLPGESQGQGNMVGCRLWGHTESDILRRGVRASGPSQERTGESGAFGLWPHPRGSSRISS